MGVCFLKFKEQSPKILLGISAILIVISEAQMGFVRWKNLSAHREISLCSADTA